MKNAVLIDLDNLQPSLPEVEHHAGSPGVRWAFSSHTYLSRSLLLDLTEHDYRLEVLPTHPAPPQALDQRILETARSLSQDGVQKLLLVSGDRGLMRKVSSVGFPVFRWLIRDAVKPRSGDPLPVRLSGRAPLLKSEQRLPTNPAKLYEDILDVLRFSSANCVKLDACLMVERLLSASSNHAAPLLDAILNERLLDRQPERVRDWLRVCLSSLASANRHFRRFVDGWLRNERLSAVGREWLERLQHSIKKQSLKLRFLNELERLLHTVWHLEGHAPERAAHLVAEELWKAANDPAEFRALLGWTRREMAIRLGVHPETVGRWERRESRPSRAAMERVCHVLEQQLGRLPQGRTQQVSRALEAPELRRGASLAGQ